MVKRLIDQIRELLFTALLIVCLLGMGLYTSFAAVLEEGTLLSGSKVNTLDVSGLQIEQAIEHVSRAEEARILDKIVLRVKVGKTERTFTAKDVGASTDSAAALTAAFAPVTQGNAVGRINALYKLRQGITVPVSLVCDPSKVYDLAQEFASQFEQEAQDASLMINIESGGYEFTADQPGYRLDAALLSRTMWERLQAGDMTPIEMELSEVPASVSEAILRESVVRLSAYETALPTDRAQVKALKQFAQVLNGAVVKPGEIFSLRDHCKQAGITPDSGRAASQAAGTLYNAALLADARRVGREANGRPQEYLPIGLDAALSQKQDLVLSNPGRTPMYIAAACYSGYFVVEVHGQPLREEQEIRLRGVIDRTIEPDPPLFISDSHLKNGTQVVETQPQPGYRVSSYREYYQNGMIVKSELLDLDIYPPIQGIYRKGGE